MKEVRLKRLCELVTDPGLGGERPFVALEHVVGGTGSLRKDIELPRRVPAAGLAAVEPGDVLFGKLRPYLAKTFRVAEPMFASTELMALRPASNVDSRWLHYLMMSDRIIGWAVATSDGSKMPRTNWSELGEYRVPIPEPNSQRAIADFLDGETARIDALIGKKRRLASLLLDRVESLVSERVRGIEAGRGFAPLKTVADVRVSNVDKKSVEGEEPVRLCNYTDVYYGREISASSEFMSASATREQIRAFELRRGDVLITKDSEMADDIGIPAYVPEDMPGVVLGYHTALIRPRSVEGEYLFWVLNGRRSRDHFSLAASGVTRFGLRQGDIGNLPVPAATPSEQTSIAREIRKSVAYGEKTMAALERQITLLAEHRQALITAAVTGRVGVSGGATS